MWFSIDVLKGAGRARHAGGRHARSGGHVRARSLRSQANPHDLASFRRAPAARRLLARRKRDEPVHPEQQMRVTTTTCHLSVASVLDGVDTARCEVADTPVVDTDGSAHRVELIPAVREEPSKSLIPSARSHSVATVSRWGSYARSVPTSCGCSTSSLTRRPMVVPSSRSIRWLGFLSHNRDQILD